MIRCLITDGKADLSSIAQWLEREVELIQIREHSLTTRELAAFTRKVLALRTGPTKILINDRADVAIACGADGVHLRDGSPQFAHSGLLVSVAIHRVEQIPLTKADFILLAPIFAPLSKAETSPPLGLAAIQHAAALTQIPILALGGITEANAQQCVDAGASGIAGISYFSPTKARA